MASTEAIPNHCTKEDEVERTKRASKKKTTDVVASPEPAAPTSHWVPSLGAVAVTMELCDNPRCRHPKSDHVLTGKGARRHEVCMTFGCKCGTKEQKLKGAEVHG